MVRLPIWLLPFLPALAVAYFFGKIMPCVAIFQFQSVPPNLSHPQGLSARDSFSQSVNLSGWKDLVHQTSDTKLFFATLEASTTLTSGLTFFF